MGKRLALAFARARPRLLAVTSPGALLPSVSLPTIRGPSHRQLAVVAGVVGAFALAFIVALVTPLFAVKTITVSGGSPSAAREVRTSLDDVLGASLVAVDAPEIEDRIVMLPSIRAARVDRAFPHELVVVVEAERPLAVVRQGQRAWVVAESGAVIRAVEDDLPHLPRIRLSDPVALRSGDVVHGSEMRAALGLLRALPRRFPARIQSVRTVEGGLTAVVGAELELRLGLPEDLELKLQAAAAVLRSLPEEEKQALAYLDVGVPQRPVAAANTQPESES